jgi:hypothetical protein
MATFETRPCGIFSVSSIVRGDDFGAETFGLAAGCGTAVLIRCTDANILRVDEPASTIQRFEDDAGTDLRTGPDDPNALFPRLGVSVFTGPQPHDDPRGVVVMFGTRATPAPAATGLRVEATVQLVTATRRDIVDIAHAPLAAGELPVGDLAIAIEGLGPSILVQNAVFVIRFRVPVDNQRRIIDMTFADAAGNPLGFAKQTVPPFDVFECIFPNALDAVAMHFEFWSGISNETVPVAADFTLGFAS